MKNHLFQIIRFCFFCVLENFIKETKFFCSLKISYETRKKTKKIKLKLSIN